MKLFVANFAGGSSTPESSIVLAEDIKEAKSLIVSLVDCDAIFVDCTPYKEDECQVVGKPMTKKGLIYTGYYCC